METSRFIIDIHTHLLDGGLYTDDSNNDPISYALKEMDRSRVSISVLLGVGFNDELDENNNLVRKAVDNHPDRFIGFFGANPHEGEKSVVKINRAIEDWGFRGIKMHQWIQMFPTNDPIVFPIMERAAHYKVPVIFHSGTPPYTTPLLIADLARQFPTVPVIIGHMGKTTLYYDCLTVLRQVDNVYCDFSGNPLAGVLEKGIKEIGAHKFLYGSDEFGAGPGQGYGIQQLLHLNITEQEKDMILCGNAAKLLGIRTSVGKGRGIRD